MIFGFNGEGLKRGQSRYGNSSDWDESKHSRDESGQFSSGGGGGGKAGKSSEKTEKKEASEKAKKSVLTGDPAKAHESPEAVSIGEGWKLHENKFMGPAITHEEHGFHLIDPKMVKRFGVDEAAKRKAKIKV